MPFGDGTGPQGNGPGTGRGAENCADNNWPEKNNTAADDESFPFSGGRNPNANTPGFFGRRGRGRGRRGGGRGRGFRR